jgi:hypothetical protein
MLKKFKKMNNKMILQKKIKHAQKCFKVYIYQSCKKLKLNHLSQFIKDS